jgi:glycosyltransferase involved in cell wall biosynthesis
MRVALLGSNPGDPQSGEGRFLRNLAVGLRRAGVEVSIICVYLPPSVKDTLERESVSSFGLFERSRSKYSTVSQVTASESVPRKLAKLARTSGSWDHYVVLSDDLIACSKYLPADNLALISQGDYAFLFMNPHFYSDHRLLKNLLSLDVARMILKHGEAAGSYSTLLANSMFTRSLMSFIYGRPFSGVVYPPVDREVFTPPTSKPDADFVLALARNDHEHGLSIIGRIARTIPVKLVGGAKVSGAESLGIVSELVLRELYQRAAFLAFPVPAEPFGYAPVEAMSCGTPSIVFDCCGPAETITHGVTGWKAATTDGFVKAAEEAFRGGISLGVREAARKASEAYSIDASAKRLLTALGSKL